MMGNRLGHLVKSRYFWLLAAFLIMLGMYLWWFAKDRITAFKDYHHSVAKQAVLHASEQVSRAIDAYNRRVQRFADQNIDLIRRFAANPDNEELHERLKLLIEENFPGYFAFTVANKAGIPVIEDFDGLVAEFCRVDMKSFAETQKYQQYIHPNYEGYHFDTIVNYGVDEGMLFVSFRADVLGNYIRSAQAPGHQLMLVYPALKQLIEVIAKGARNKIVRDDYRLSNAEKLRILDRLPVTGTRWEAVDLITPGFFDSYDKKLYWGLVVNFLAITLVGFILVWIISREKIARINVEKHTQELVGVISHELRTPAASIHGAMELIARGTVGPTNSELKHLLDMVNDNSLHLLSLVNNFIDIRKHESGNLNLDLKNCELYPIVEKSIQNIKSYASQLNVVFLLSSDAERQVRVNCDPLRIEQVMANLLSNAAKYGSEKDEIEVQIKRIDNHKVRVSVSDHGSGVDPGVKDKVFEKFVMTKPTKLNDNIRSSGLGLSIARAIIEEHGGCIDYTTSDTGTMFYFELPVTDN